jgi:glycosyltransferase involved in cell wall biosynthesis
MNKKITIGMPTKNRELTIDSVLKSLSSQIYPKKDIKVVFVDESTDTTFEKLFQWKEKNEKLYSGIQIITDYKSSGYISAARNVCIANMEGEIMFFWDSDVIPPNEKSLSRVLDILKDDSIQASGLQYFTEHPSLYERTMQMETVLNATGFTAIRKSVFEKIGLFNEQLKIQEDADLFGRMATHGLKTKIDDSPPALHLKPNNKKLGIRHEFSSYRFHLKYCFTQESTLVESQIKEGSKAFLIRMLYYFALPLLVIFWITDIFFPVINMYWATMIVGGYILLNLIYQVHKTKKNRLTGIITFLYRTPIGIASYYGFLVSRIKRLIHRNKN